MLSLPSLSFLLLSLRLVSKHRIFCNAEEIVGATTTATTTVHETTRNCHEAGFDPLQLSCETCDLLPTHNNNVIAKCQECCQSFLVAKNRAQRYQAAILLHNAIPNLYPEVHTFVDEDMDQLVQSKGSQRFRLLTIGEDGGGISIYDPHQPPSTILWFDNIPPANLGIHQLTSTAKELIVLNGWKRDDIRDMLSSLLPDLE